MPYGVPGPSAMFPQAGQFMPIPQQHQNEQLRKFWVDQQKEIEQVWGLLRTLKGLMPAGMLRHALMDCWLPG